MVHLYNANILFVENVVLTEPKEEALHTDPPEEQPLGEDDSDTTHPMDVLLESESYDLEMPRRGEVRTGTVARVTETDVLVDVGAKSEGVIPARELERLPFERREALTVGTEVDVYVIRSGGRDGTLLLSVIRAEEEQDWREAERLLETRDLYEGIINGYNKGGLIVKLGRLRGFVPASQVSLSRRRRAQGSTPEQRWGAMVDEPIIAKVIEVDRRRNRLILSERAAAREARDRLKERLIAEMEPGEIRKGHVISLANFGAFVDIGGADGLVHMSELSWKRIEHPRDVLKVGQEIEVKVLSVDPDRRRISLSLRELEPDPWNNFIDQYQEGQLVEGAITKLTNFGAFASIVGNEEYDFEGLIHISELSDKRIEHPREVVKEDQRLPMRVIKIDRKRRRIGLSLRKVDSVEYAEQDWQAAMADIEGVDEGEIAITTADHEEEPTEAVEPEATSEDEAGAVDVAEEPEPEFEVSEAEVVIESEMVDEEVAVEEEPDIVQSESDRESDDTPVKEAELEPTAMEEAGVIDVAEDSEPEIEQGMIEEDIEPEFTEELIPTDEEDDEIEAVDEIAQAEVKAPEVVEMTEEAAEDLETEASDLDPSSDDAPVEAEADQETSKD
jgi:small subunit ribosomal protein S1